MSKAATRPRTYCVYCGKRIPVYCGKRISGGRLLERALACVSHRRLVASDPMYAADLGEAVPSLKGKGA